MKNVVAALVAAILAAVPAAVSRREPSPLAEASVSSTATGRGVPQEQSRPIVVPLGPHYYGGKFPRGLFLINPRTGERIRRISRDYGREPVWSPDGRKVVYATGYGNEIEFWVARRDGSGVRRITHNSRTEEWPSWSPDSTRVVVSRYDDGDVSGPDTHDLYLVRTNGSGERRLTHTPRRKEQCAVWAPDGSRIAYVEPDDIFTIKPDGTRKRELTSGVPTDYAPLWSPDSRKIVFSRGYDGLPGNDLYVMRRDGSDVTRLTNNIPDELNVTWSPDGGKIAFISGTEEHPSDSSLWVMRANGSGKRLLFRGDRNSTTAYRPTWSPNSRRLVYLKVTQGRPGDHYDTCSVRVDGTHDHALTSTARFDEGGPDWHSPSQNCRSLY